MFNNDRTIISTMMEIESLQAKTITIILHFTRLNHYLKNDRKIALTIIEQLL